MTPFVQAKDYDHEDVEIDFRMGAIRDTLAAIGVFLLLVIWMWAALELPDKYLTQAVLYFWGL